LNLTNKDIQTINKQQLNESYKSIYCTITLFIFADSSNGISA